MWSLIGLPAGARNSAGSKRLFLMVRRSATSCAEAPEASIRKLAPESAAIIMRTIEVSPLVCRGSELEADLQLRAVALEVLQVEAVMVDGQRRRGGLACVEGLERGLGALAAVNRLMAGDLRRPRGGEEGLFRELQVKRRAEIERLALELPEPDALVFAPVLQLASDREVRREAQGKRGREREGRLALERLEARAHPLGLVECVEGEEQPVRHELGVGAELEFGLEPLQPFARRVVDSGIGRLDREGQAEGRGRPAADQKVAELAAEALECRAVAVLEFRDVADA